MSHLDDNDVLALVSGRLGLERLRAVEAHLDECDDCRELAAASSRPLLEGELPEAPKSPAGAQQLGRYWVLKPVGAGAMGIVYAAYDPVLDRRVALKLLHAGGGDADKLRARLLREAQAMARLTHPNVIAVHDVGTVQEQVFVAMEFVEGQTLAKWISAKHPRKEVLRVFVLAGRGLAAAHAAGLVHRDFKPENVLVGDDGRVRVTDFGLARAQKPAAGPAAEPATPDTASSPAGSRSAQGALIGSPAYMAPEQLRGEPVDARADEFSFCVALYEALYGERPFAGAALLALREAIEKNEVRPEPAGARVPGWLRRVLLRGLKSKPEDRFPTLDALLDALEADPALARQQVFFGLATLLLLAGLFLLIRWQSGRGEKACQGADAKVQTVWAASVRNQAAQAFAASQLPYARGAWAVAQKALDGYAGSWAQMRTDACEATQLRHEQSPELLDLRMLCLDDRLRDLGAVARLLTQADDAVVSHATNLASGLPPLSGCADAHALREPGAPATNQREPVASLEERLAAVHALHVAGKPTVPEARALLADARKVGYAPLEARVLFELAIALNQEGKSEEAQRLFPEAAAEGLRARVDPVVASAWIEALHLDVALSRLEDADLAAKQAKAAVARLGTDAVLPQSQLASALSSYARRNEQMDEAESYAAQAVSLLEHSRGNERELVVARGELALALGTRGKFAQALAVQESSWSTSVAQYGAEHPMSGQMESEYGNMLCYVNRKEECLGHLNHALAVMEKALGPNHPAVADIVGELADKLISTDPKRAEALARRSVAIQDASPPTSTLAYAHTLLGGALEAQGDHAAARAELFKAIALERKITGQPEDLEIAIAQEALGEIYFNEGKLDLAREQLAAARLAFQKGYGDHVETAQALEMLARISLAELKLTEANGEAEKALQIEEAQMPDSKLIPKRQLLLARIEQERGRSEESYGILKDLVDRPAAKSAADEPFDRDEARFLLARAMWNQKVDKTGALALAGQARKSFVARGKPGAKAALEVKSWLALHSLTPIKPGAPKPPLPPTAPAP